MTDAIDRPARRVVAVVAAFAALLLVGATAVLWAWNTVVVDVFAAPVLAYRHALAMEIGAAVIGATAALSARFGGRRERHAA